MFKVSHAFLDIGGVLLTDGWARDSRKRVVDSVGIDWDEFELRHHQTFETFESGRITLGDYLQRTVFYSRRSFSEQRFRELMLSQSRAFSPMISLFRRLKKRYRLKLVVVSNEGRELNAFRIKRFGLDRLIDTFISSCFINRRKPDVEVFRLALDVTQADPAQVVYIDNISMFVALAQKLGMRGIHHTDIRSTMAELSDLGLRDRKQGRHAGT